MKDPTREFVLLQQAVAGRYSIDRELGRGGMGIVFLAREVVLDRLVALKMLPPEFAADEVRRRRFVDEARIAARLTHPNIVPIHAVEEIDDVVFYVMAFVDGRTLGEQLMEPASMGQRIRWLQECAFALAHAHEHGIVHRDVKPDNLLIERESGRALVTDFGIARAATAEVGGAELAGTPQYMSPEQTRGDAPDPLSDVYSFGVMAFQVLTGRAPFSASTPGAMFVKHVREAPPRVLELAPDVPRRLATLIDDCLQKDPAARPDSMEVVARELSATAGAMAVLPVPLKTYLRESEMIAREVGNYVASGGLLVGIAQIIKIAQGDFLGIITGIQVAIAAGLAGLTISRLPALLPVTRRVLAAGYTRSDVTKGLDREERDVTGFDDRPGASQWVRDAAVVVGAGAIAALAIGWLSVVESDFNIFLGVAALISSPVVVMRHFFGRFGSGRWWGRLLRGRVGEWLFKLSGMGMGDIAPALPPAGESTVLAVGHQAAELFAELPEGQRRRFPEAPSIIARLEADALLVQNLGPDHPQAERFQTAVAALESLRLDLLRLHSGGGSFDDLTEDLERARQLAEDIRREIEAGREVERLLKDTPVP